MCVLANSEYVQNIFLCTTFLVVILCKLKVYVNDCLLIKFSICFHLGYIPFYQVYYNLLSVLTCLQLP